MPVTKREEAQQALGQLFGSLAIKRIICVDDVYALPFGQEEAIGLIGVLDLRVAAGVIGNKDIPLGEERDIWVGPFKAWWETLAEDQRKSLLQRLYNAHAQAGDAIARAGQDWKSATALSELFAGQEFLELSFSQWKIQKDDRLRESKTSKTLFLFDEDLTNDGGTDMGGRQLIKEVLASPDARTSMCGLLSHNIPPEREFDIWKDFKSAEYGFDSDRVVPVSKRTLEARPLEFARAIKLTLLNPDCHALAKLSGQLMKKSHAKAQERLEEINIYAFDHMVFRTSNREGVWEPDTLFRLLNLFQRLNARVEAKKNSKLRRLAERIRSVSDIPTEADSKSKPDDAWKIQRLELYETADFINNNLLPIELGDIFEKTAENEAERGQYILLAQPCDLMVRTDTGRRKETTTRVVLARIKNDKPSPRQDEYFTLPHFESAKDNTAFVDFTETHLVSLNMLDLCAFGREGAARIKLSDKSDHLVLAWRKHHQVVLEFYRELIESKSKIENLISSFNRRKKPENHISEAFANSVNPEFSSPTLFTLEIDSTAKSVAFDCRRIGRFEPNHAADMWTKFCNFTARAAFDVDLGA